MENPGVTTIVVNWNLLEETSRCLHSLQQLNYPSRIILVDNGSRDGSINHISDHFPLVEIISLPKNVGFSQACNLGIRHALMESELEYIFLLNNDAVIHCAALQRLVKASLAVPQAGILGPKIYYQYPPRKIWYAGARRRWGVLAAACKGRNTIDYGQFDQASLVDVDYIFGAAMFIRRSVFEHVGLFDERYFLYLEDLDFCLRAQQAGFSLLYVPSAKAWHIGSASTSKDMALRRYHHVRSTILFLKQHSSKLSIMPALLFWTLVLLRMVIADLLHGNLNAINSYWSALVNGLSETQV